MTREVTLLGPDGKIVPDNKMKKIRRKLTENPCEQKYFRKAYKKGVVAIHIKNFNDSI